ncbi:hypothetical protein PM082_017498 [Marasmius tenuissimus]|nr:hypothetical protein PM082_017498 [Marasmius tenuissimus]
MDMECAERVEALSTLVIEKAWSDNIQEIHNSPKLSILQSRYSPGHVPQKLGANFDFQRYLSAPIVDHRKSLTRFVTSTHRLAVETLRWTTTLTGKTIPRDARVCRYGCSAVEDEMHVFWRCNRPPILRLERNIFITKALRAWPEFERVLRTDNPLAIFNTAVDDERLIPSLATYIHKALEIFSEIPAHIPSGSDIASLDVPAQDDGVPEAFVVPEEGDNDLLDTYDPLY